MTADRNKPLKCFLLAAGLGERLRPLTDTIPKCLLPIGGKPLLGIWLEHLKCHGITELLVNTHWLHKKVEAFLERWHEDCPKIRPFYEPTLLGSAGTLLANQHWVADGESFFIIYGDNLTNVNLTAMIAFHNQHSMPLTLGVFKTDRPKECGIVEIGNHNVVIGFVEKPENPATDLAAAGVYVANKKIFEYFPKSEASHKGTPPQPLDLSFHALPKLVGNMKAYFIREPLIDIGTLESYEKAGELWKTRFLLKQEVNPKNQNSLDYTTV